jgi:hypothetical protein
VVTYRCPVCGYPGLGKPAYSRRTGLGSHQICPACGDEYGVTDDAGVSHAEWRARWVEAGMPWRDEGVTEPPAGWDPRAHLATVTGG